MFLPNDLLQTTRAIGTLEMKHSPILVCPFGDRLVEEVVELRYSVDFYCLSRIIWMNSSMSTNKSFSSFALVHKDANIARFEWRQTTSNFRLVWFQVEQWKTVDIVTFKCHSVHVCRRINESGQTRHTELSITNGNRRLSRMKEYLLLVKMLLSDHCCDAVMKSSTF